MYDLEQGINESTGTPGARDGEAWTPVAESMLTLVVPWIARNPTRVGHLADHLSVGPVH
jgi:hypothetical protein